MSIHCGLPGYPVTTSQLPYRRSLIYIQNAIISTTPSYHYAKIILQIFNTTPGLQDKHKKTKEPSWTPCRQWSCPGASTLFCLLCLCPPHQENPEKSESFFPAPFPAMGSNGHASVRERGHACNQNLMERPERCHNPQRGLAMTAVFR